MLDIPLRRWKDRLVDPVARAVPGVVTPGHVTLAAFLCGLLACLAAMSMASPQMGICLWLLNRFLDCLDGSLARSRNAATDLGGFLDLLSDFIVYSLLPIAICLGQEAASVDWAALALLEASFHVNNFILFYSAAIAAKRHDDELTSVTMRPALVEGFESGVIFTAMLIWPSHINLWMWVMSFGVAIGICQRALAVTSSLSQVDRNRKAH
jgi:phosphatidylglycerophosphate synthase